jgi:hypothetical protein
MIIVPGPKHRLVLVVYWTQALSLYHELENNNFSHCFFILVDNCSWSQAQASASSLQNTST